MARLPLNHGGGQIPALGFGTLIPDPAVTVTATRDALEAGFRHFDCAERYRNEREVGEALQAGLAAQGMERQDIFVTTKLWNSNHRPERVAPAFEASLDRLKLNYLDLYLINTPFAFQPGDEQDPRDQNGNVLYDGGVTLLDTWRAMESLVDRGRCRAIGLSDITLNKLLPLYEICQDQASPSSGRVPSLSAGDGAFGVLQETWDCVFGVCSVGSRNEAGPARKSGDFRDCGTGWNHAGAGAVGLGSAAWHGIAHHTENCCAGKREFRDIRASPRRIR